jgi:DeoR family glycerol-3-phosphate regulon repressor
MYLTERQAGISELLRQSEFLTVESLAQKFNVTTQTVRKDINALCDLGLARRRHGGVELFSTEGNLAYRSRQVLNRVAKMAIAAEVAKNIPNDSSISLGIGTTPEIVATALLKHSNLKVFTNSLTIAQIMSANSGFEINIPGGRIRNSDHDILGRSTEAFFSAYKTDFGIFGVAGVDEDGGLLDFYEEEVVVRNLIRVNCRQSFLVLDHHKFGRSAHVRGGNIQDNTRIFCDKTPPVEITRIVDSTDAKIIICNGEKIA